MINDDKRVLEYCKSLLDYTKGDKNVLISRQNFEYLFNILNKHFILEAALEKVKETSEDRKLKINRQTKEINRLHEKINELEQSHVDVVNEYKEKERNLKKGIGKSLDIFDQQNKRYREALEEIKKEETVTTALSEGQVAYTISGHIARKALDGDLDE